MGITGEELVYGFKKGTAWGTAVACGAGDGFLGLAANNDPQNDDQVDDSLGQYFAVESTPGETKLDGSIPFYLRYNDKVIWQMIAQFMGTAGVPATHAAGTLSKDHTLKIAKEVDGLFGTFVADLGGVFVEEVPSLKLAKMVVTWETGKPIHVALSGPGFDLVTDSVINTTTTANNITVLERKNRSYMAQTVTRMNNQSAIALAEGDKIGPNKIVLTAERKLTGYTGTFVSGGRDVIDEPTNDGPWNSTLTLSFPRTIDAAGRADIKANTSKKMEIITTGPIIEGAIPYLIRWRFPNLVPKKNSNPHKQGGISLTKEYSVIGADVAPAGMTNITEPFQIDLTNKQSADLLA